MRIQKLVNSASIGIAYVLLFAPLCIIGKDDENPGGLMPVPTNVCAKLKALFQKYYPKATFTNTGLNGIFIGYEVTTFEFPYTGPAGAKHETTTHRGPKKGGIYCSVSMEKGEYNGQIALYPQGSVRDRKFYKELQMVPYSAKRDIHLGVSLCYPPDASKEFLKEFCAIMDDFAQDADQAVQPNGATIGSQPHSTTPSVRTCTVFSVAFSSG